MVQFSPKAFFREHFNLSRLAINHARVTLFIWIIVCVAGLFAFSSLKYALFPDITFPVVVVNASAPAETALATETELTNPIESSLAQQAHLSQMASTTYTGHSVINLQFDVGTDLEASTAAVEEALAPLALPAESTYQVIPLNLNEEAAISYAITYPEGDLAALAEIANADIIPKLEAIPGVLRIDLLGTARQTLAAGTAQEATTPNLQNPPTLIRFNGEDTLAFQVIKRGNANTLEVVDQVETAISGLQADLPELQFTQAATQADYIRETNRATIDSLLLAIVIAVLVIFGFLKNWQATLITSLAIPMSLLGTFIVMAIYKFNLETITLLALALVIGIIVDDAIVEIENIMRHLEAGATPKQAALAATREVGLTVSASTLSISAVFLPVALMGGTVGQFFKPFGLTISASVLVSLMVARTLTPVLAVYWLRRRPHPALSSEPPEDLGQPSPEETGLILDAPADSWLSKFYDKLLAWAIHHRWAVVGIAIATFLAGLALIPLVPQGFIPKLDRGEFNITYQAPVPQIAALAGTNPATGNPPQLDPTTIDPTTMDPSQLDPTQIAPGSLNDNPLASSPTAAIPNPLLIAFEQSQQVAADLEAVTRRTEGVASVFTTVGIRGNPNQGKLYVKLQADRPVTTAEVQDQLRANLPQREGITTSVEDVQFVDTGGEKPLQVVLQGDNLAALNTAVLAIKERVAALPGFVDVSVSGAATATETVTEINHRDGHRVAYVTANLSEGQALGKATDQVVAIATEVIPPEISLDLGADSARLGEVLSSFAGILGPAILCMILVLLIPFGRLLEPTVVGLSLPFAIIGAMLALLITRSDFGMISVIGLLFLLGLLDKNALLLMDYINQLRRAGLNRDKAILVTGLVRLRPILMTTASTILGMLPIALGLGAGSELRQPMAVAIIGGLFTSTLLSLIVVPVLYTLLEDGWQRLTKPGS
jgi:multidrug efflux pump subunit AcrB